MAEETADFRRRARLGIFILIGRTALLQLVILAGKVYLARVLGPADFGAFWIVQHALAFFLLFGDAGLGASLVQKKTKPTDRELSTIWWTQTALALVVVGTVWIGAPYVLRLWPDLPPEAPWLMRALSLELFLTVLRVMPAILMERELLFGRLAILDVLGMTLFYGVASLLARRYGVYALVVAVLTSGVVGAIVTFFFRPWRPRFVFDRKILRESLRFGIAYQTKNLVGFLNAAVVPIYGGARLGRYGMGLVSWSQTIAYFPLQLGDIVSRVNFPLFSRLQSDRKALAALLARAICVCGVVTYLFIALFAGLGDRFVSVVYGPKWVPATPTLYVFSGMLVIGFLVPLLASALDAIGRPGVMMRLGIFWTTLNWIIVVTALHFRTTPLVFALAYAVHVVIGNALAIYVVRDMVDLRRIARRLGAALLAAIVAGLVSFRFVRPWVQGPGTLTLAIVALVVLYGAVATTLDRGLVADVRRAFKPKDEKPVEPEVVATASPS